MGVDRAWVLLVLRVTGGITFLSSPEADAIIQKAAPHTQELVDVVLVIAMIYSIFGALFDIFMGMFVLAGANWARILYVVAEVLTILVDIRFYPTQIVLNTLTAVVAIVVLFLPSSNRYFAVSR